MRDKILTGISFEVIPKKKTKKEKETAKLMEKLLDYEYEKMMQDPDRRTLYFQYVFYRGMGIPHEALLHIWNKFFELHEKYLKGETT